MTLRRKLGPQRVNWHWRPIAQDNQRWISLIHDLHIWTTSEHPWIYCHHQGHHPSWANVLSGWPASSLDDLGSYSHWPASSLDDLRNYSHWPASFLDDFLQHKVINVSSLVCKLLCSRSYKSVLTVIHSHCPCNWGNHCIDETTNLFVQCSPSGQTLSTACGVLED